MPGFEPGLQSFGDLPRTATRTPLRYMFIYNTMQQNNLTCPILSDLILSMPTGSTVIDFYKTNSLVVRHSYKNLIHCILAFLYEKLFCRQVRYLSTVPTCHECPCSFYRRSTCCRPKPMITWQSTLSLPTKIHKNLLALGHLFRILQ